MPGDRLTGGAGNDVLALYGSGAFHVDQLATFTGFASITLSNFTNGIANLYLGSQPIAVTGYGSGSGTYCILRAGRPRSNGAWVQHHIQHFSINLERRKRDRWLSNGYLYLN